jgi:adenylate cyclase
LLRYFDPPLRKTFYAGLYNDLCFSALKNGSNKIGDDSFSSNSVRVQSYSKRKIKELKNIQMAAEECEMVSPMHPAACVTPVHT